MLYCIQEQNTIMIIARNNTTFSNTDKLPKGLNLQSSFSNSKSVSEHAKVQLKETSTVNLQNIV